MKIKIAITDERLPRSAEIKLLTLGFHTILLPPFSRLGNAVASHTDMLILASGNTLFSHADYCEEHPEIFERLYSIVSKGGVSMRFVHDEVSEKYPNDARLNVLVLGNTVFAKADSVSDTLLNYFNDHGYKTVNVKQGYPACTVLKIGEGCAVTADRGMAKVLSDTGIKTSLIENGHITLEPYEYGFIGGCAGRFENKIYFSGCIESHPSYDIIRRAADECGMELISLGDFPLIDVGGIILAEYELE